MIVALLACAVPTDGSAAVSDAADTAEGAAADTAGDDTGDPSGGETPALLVEPSGGACPSFDEPGRIDLVSSGKERKAQVYWPSAGAGGAPVLFVWHPLGGTAKQMISYLDLESLAEDRGVIVVAPDADAASLFDWNFLDTPDDNYDLVLFDDLRTCAARELGADATRVYTTGMSAGALWTTYLGIQRGDTLAAVLVMSGGTGDVLTYGTPAYAFPALLTHGGETDTYNAGVTVLHFDEMTEAFAESLIADDHFVEVCAHDGGHDFPPDAPSLVADWLLPHRYGDPSPFAPDGAGLPEMCAPW
jgi:poly(3-hydroxybutyrate) depolymerase